jgi:D-glycero-D-manno-heptose 1,7-bisphosphate phosphatase
MTGAPRIARSPAACIESRPAVFVDQEGTLVETVPFGVDPSQLRFMPGAPVALAELSRRGFALVVVSNQSGLALRHFSRAQLAHLQRTLEQRLWDEAGVRLTDFLVCPHAPGADGRPACLCRKPAPGLLLQAARTRGLDLARSCIVGDTLDDVEAGHRAGCRGFLFDSGGETVWRRSPIREPEAVVSGWAAAVAMIGEPAPPAARAKPARLARVPAGDRPSPCRLVFPLPVGGPERPVPR